MAYLPTLLDVFRRFPAANDPLLEFHEALLRGPSPFTEGERELIAAYVSGLKGCRNCHGVHTATAERMGIVPGAIAALLAGDETTAIPDKMRPVLSLSKRLTERPDGVTQSDVNAVFAAGWNDTAFYHSVAVVDLLSECCLDHRTLRRKY